MANSQKIWALLLICYDQIIHWTSSPWDQYHKDPWMNPSNWFCERNELVHWNDLIQKIHSFHFYTIFIFKQTVPLRYNEMYFTFSPALFTQESILLSRSVSLKYNLIHFPLLKCLLITCLFIFSKIISESSY